MGKCELTPDHKAAANRSRRIVVNYDIWAFCCDAAKVETHDAATLDRLIQPYMQWLDDAGNQLDSLWYCFGEGNTAHWPSRVLPVWKQYLPWFDAGLDPYATLIAATRKRGREVFYSYRINGIDENTDNIVEQEGKWPVSALKQQHPDWLLDTLGNGKELKWNFAPDWVRKLKLDTLREVAERYDVDGIELDFARCTPVLPIGHQWEHREALTDFMRQLRRSLQEIAARRGRPLLLAARIPERIEGCHFDGIDIETWIAENLLDILALGIRSFDVDLAGYRQLLSGNLVKLIPVYDAHHASDGYKLTRMTPEEARDVVRGVTANWWQQGADGVQIFNFPGAPAHDRHWEVYRRLYREIGSAATLLGKSKTFPVQRRAGGHPWFFGFPEQGLSQSLMYHNSNMLAWLPARLGVHGHNLTILPLSVGDDLNRGEAKPDIRLRLLVSDPGAVELPAEARIEPGLIRRGPYGESEIRTQPPAREMAQRLEVRLNNIALGTPRIEAGWLTCAVAPKQLATGTNLVGIRLADPEPSAVTIEKVELSVVYADEP